MEFTAIAVAITIEKKLDKNIKNIAGLSPIPNQSIANGIHAKGEIGRKNWINGLKFGGPPNGDRCYSCSGGQRMNPWSLLIQGMDSRSKAR